MKVTVRRAGRGGVLIELPDPDGVLDLARRITAALGAAGLEAAGLEVQPAARTILVRVDPDMEVEMEVDSVRQVIDRIAAEPAGTGAFAPEDTELVIPVRYDGADLDDVCQLTGLSRSEVVAAHTGTPWRAAFTGFAPGFCYLTGGDPRLDVPRRNESRPQVAAGSVALAGGYAAVYPAASPGGWQLLGTTDRVLWDPSAAEPALIRPGMLIRFVEADTTASHFSATHEKTVATTGLHASGAASSSRALIVRDPGPLSLLQDAGRPGLTSSGVGRSGAADRASFRLANALVGNIETAVVIECTFGGLTVQARGDQLVAVTGAPATVMVNGDPVEHAAAVRLRDGCILKIGSPKVGLRNYLAVRGGIEVPAVLGSASTDVLSGLGPPAVRRGDHLPVGDAVAFRPTSPVRPNFPVGRVLELPITAGPRDDWLVNSTDLAAGEWVVSPQSNRIGLRLDRPPADPAPALQRRDQAELPSEGVVLGSIQVPPSGQPVVFLADHPVTGGYPVIAVLEPSAVDQAAQARPGQHLRFRFVDPDRPAVLSPPH